MKTFKRNAEYYRKYYQKHKEKIRAYQNEYYHRPRVNESALERQKKWRQKHKLINLSWNLKRYGSDIKPWQLFGILKQQKMICPLTGRKITNENISLDHIIPKSKGGLTELENIRFIVNDINKAKGTLNDLELIELCKEVLTHAGAGPLSSEPCSGRPFYG